MSTRCDNFKRNLLFCLSVLTLDSIYWRMWVNKNIHPHLCCDVKATETSNKSVQNRSPQHPTDPHPPQKKAAIIIIISHLISWWLDWISYATPTTQTNSKCGCYLPGSISVPGCRSEQGMQGFSQTNLISWLCLNQDSQVKNNLCKMNNYWPTCKPIMDNALNNRHQPVTFLILHYCYPDSK